ncbi:YdcF family protein [Oenococcus sicerae]|uniref:YdcF family protein n=1 Tax=Oenococcus sicerae TaxID=2203724 RepID=A0AAJ1VNF1_9LACO|nr:YdcF family protein [Oenococcus sicerae]
MFINFLIPFTQRSAFLYFALALIFLIIFAYSVRKDYRFLKNGWFLNLAIESFLFGLFIWARQLNADLFQVTRFVILLLIASVVILAFYSGITLVIWSFKMSKNAKYRSRYRFSTHLVMSMFTVLCLLAFIQLAHINIPKSIAGLVSFVPLFVIYLGFVFADFMTQTILVNLIGYKISLRRKKYAYLIILGAGLLKGDQISENLQNRLQAGLNFVLQHPETKIIVSGGKGSDERISEAQAMKQWLVKKGLLTSRVLMEDLSTNTKENFQKSMKVIRDNETKGKIDQLQLLFVTNSYHLARANFIALSQRLPINGLPAKTTRNYLASGWFREFAAILLIKKRQHLFVLLLLLINSFIIALFLGLTNA